MKDMPFEKALEKLEKIVDELEEGDMPLDTSLKKYEEGVKLAGVCHEKLNKAKQKIELLSKNKSGKFTIKDLQSEEDEG